jgi:hypothetical protein
MVELVDTGDSKFFQTLKWLKIKLSSLYKMLKTKVSKSDLIKKDWSIRWKQNYTELSEKYKVTIKTIQKRLNKYKFIPPFVIPTKIILLMDTTYFWEFWLMVFKDYKSKKIINYKLIKIENCTDYKNWVKELQEL